MARGSIIDFIDNDIECIDLRNQLGKNTFFI